MLLASPLGVNRSARLFEKSDEVRFIATGDDRDRTGNPCLAKAVLSQLSYVPEAFTLPVET